MTALRISSKNTRNIDKVGRKFQKIVVLQTSNSMDKILNLIYGKQVVARRTWSILTKMKEKPSYQK